MPIKWPVLRQCQLSKSPLNMSRDQFPLVYCEGRRLSAVVSQLLTFLVNSMPTLEVGVLVSGHLVPLEGPIDLQPSLSA